MLRGFLEVHLFAGMFLRLCIAWVISFLKMAAQNKVMFTVLEIPDSNKKMEERSVTNPSCLLSSTSLDGNIIDLPATEETTQSDVTAILHYCKSKILNPYLRLLSIVGLRPLTNQLEPCFCLQILNYIYIVNLISLLLLGYLLQYMACFRRDRGFCYVIPNNTFLFQSEAKQIYEKICHGPVLFSFIIPSCLHFLGYLHAVTIMRHSDDNQLPVLMERVFLTSINLTSRIENQKKIIRTLWLFVAFTSIWMFFSLIVANVMMANGTIALKWVEHKPAFLIVILKFLLVFGTLWQDIVQSTIISNYCLQAQLLTSYLQFLQEKLLQYRIQPLEWIRHIENFKKMLIYINTQIAPSVCFFTFINTCYATSGIMWLFNYDSIDKETIPIMGISVLNVLLWILISLAPLIQASRLSNECDILRSAGQAVRTRPFVHQDTPGHELDSILLYTASLKLRAKLFFVPITGKYLSLFFTLVAICILVLGQCHYLNIN